MSIKAIIRPSAPRLGVTTERTRKSSTWLTPSSSVPAGPVVLSSVSLTYSADGSVNQTYTANDNTGKIPTYQWLYMDTGLPISGATAKTYVATSAALRRVLACDVTYNGITMRAVADTWVLPAPIMLARMDTMTGLTTNITPTPVAELDPVTGAKTLAAQQAGVSQGGYIQKANAGTYSAAELGVIAQINFLRDGKEWAHTTSLETRLQIGASGYITVGGTTTKAVNTLSKGRLINTYDATSVPALVSAGSGVVSTRTYLSSSGTTTGSPYAGRPRVAAVVAQAEAMPFYAYTYDDGNDTIHDWLLAQHEELGIPLTFYLPQGNIGTQYCMNETKVNRMWQSPMVDICIDGDRIDNPATNLPDTATVVSRLLEDVAYCMSKGWHIGKTTNSLMNLCWPNGTVRTSDSATNTIRLDASCTTDGSTTVTIPSANANIKVGMVVTGYLVPLNTTVVSNSGTTVVVSNAIPAAASKSLMFSDMSLPFIGTKLIDAVRAAGFKCGRATTGFGVLHDRWGMDDAAMVMPSGSMSLADLPTLKGYLDGTVAGKGLGITYGHIFSDTDPSGLATTTTVARAGLEYAASLRQQNKLFLGTVPQAINRGLASSMPFNLAA